MKSIFEKIVGKDSIVSDPIKLQELAEASYKKQTTFSLALYPKNEKEIQEIMKEARRLSLKVHPISCGKNTGYGSKSPYQDKTILLDLSRMNKILNFNENLGYVTVQPGVTFEQLFLFLRENKSNLRASCTSGHYLSSVLANALERGNGAGHYGERSEFLAGIVAILGTGEIIRTGLSSFEGAESAPVYRQGPGVSLLDSFFKTNFGIVTQATIWLMPLFNYQEIIHFYINRVEKLASISDALHELRFRSCIYELDIGISNRERMQQLMKMAFLEWPIDHTPVAIPDTPDFPHEWGIHISFFAESKEQLKANSALCKKFLKSKADAVQSICRERKEIEALIKYNYSMKKKTQKGKAPFFPFNVEVLSLGVPSTKMEGCYCQKKEIISSEPNPEKDRCGVMLLKAPVPFLGSLIQEVASLCTEILQKWNFEPIIGFIQVKERTVDLIVNLIYDREIEGEDEKADVCFKECIQRLCERGIIPTRLPRGFYEFLPKRNDDSQHLLMRMKALFDPDKVIDPERYL